MQSAENLLKHRNDLDLEFASGSHVTPATQTQLEKEMFERRN